MEMKSQNKTKIRERITESNSKRLAEERAVRNIKSMSKTKMSMKEFQLQEIKGNFQILYSKIKTHRKSLCKAIGILISIEWVQTIKGEILRVPKSKLIQYWSHQNNYRRRSMSQLKTLLIDTYIKHTKNQFMWESLFLVKVFLKSLLIMLSTYLLWSPSPIWKNLLTNMFRSI